ncbi:MAG: hypothetical protein CL844_04540 [Crocinitomicaceae bacterium]|nr:hypothetical protein [Crocinitomicaceae bacterium]
MILRNSLILIIITFHIGSCQYNRLKVNTSNINVNINYTNMDDVIFNSDSIVLMKKHQFFKNQMKEIYHFQITDCLGIGDVDDTIFYNSIIKYRGDTLINQLESDISSQFSDLSKYKDIITDGFRHLKFHFPNEKVPKNIVFLNSIFRANVFSTKNEIAVGLECFLGDSNRIIKNLPPSYYNWMKEEMDHCYLERDVINSWIQTHYFDSVNGSLVEQIIHYGKVLYLTQAAYPDFHPSIILRYSKEDYQWALDNEFRYWKYLVDQELLFKTDEKIIANMILAGPYTTGIPDRDSPDRLGQFLGYRMVNNYMNSHEIKLLDMLDLSYNEILQAFKIEK